MLEPKPPCRQCTNRKVGCHGVCHLYIKYRQDMDKFNQEQREKNKVYQPKARVGRWYQDI